MAQPDTRFSAAVHLLVLLALAEEPPSSTLMAKSVGINPSQVRKLLGMLKKNGLTTARQGVEGYALGMSPDAITLFAVHQAVYEHQGVRVMALHRNPSDECIVGRHIAPVLGDIFGELDERMAEELASITLADVVATMLDAIEADTDASEASRPDALA